MKFVTTSIAFAAVSTAAVAEAPQGVPAEWLCRADRMIVCNDGDCIEKPAKVVAEVNFDEMVLRNFALDHPTPLTSVKKTTYGQTIQYHSDGGLMWVMGNRHEETIGGAVLWDWQMVMATSGRNSLLYYGECRER